MIKNYDEALKTLNYVRNYLSISRADNCVEELDKVARYFINEKHKENPNLSECIKEWEKRGWKVDEDGYFKTITFIKGDRGICFDIEEKYYFTFQPSLETNSFDIDVELHNLIHKTLKALEEMKDE